MTTVSFGWTYYALSCALGIFTAAAIIGPRRLFDLRHVPAIFLLVMVVSYVIRPWLAFYVGNGLTLFEWWLPGISIRVRQDLLPLSILFSVALVSFAVGYRVLPRPSLGQLIPEEWGQDEERHHLVRKLALFLVVIGYLSFLAARRDLLAASATIAYIRSPGGSGYANTTGYIELANYFVVSGALLYYATTRRLLPSILMVSIWLAAQVYFGWMRMMFLVLALGYFVIWIVSSRSNKTPKWHFSVLASLTLGAVLLLLAMRGNRGFLQSGQPLPDLVEQTSALPVDNALGDFAGFEGTWFAYNTISTRTPRLGASIFYQLVVKPIPRILWTDKPFPGEFRWSTLFGKETHLSPYESIWYSGPVKGAIGEALDEGGYLGVPVTFFLTGLVFAWLERRLVRAKWSPLWLATYAATYGMISMLARNAIYSNHLTIFIFVFYVPYFVINWITHSMKPKRRTAHVASPVITPQRQEA